MPGKCENTTLFQFFVQIVSVHLFAKSFQIDIDIDQMSDTAAGLIEMLGRMRHHIYVKIFRSEVLCICTSVSGMRAGKVFEITVLIAVHRLVVHGTMSLDHQKRRFLKNIMVFYCTVQSVSPFF